MQTNFNISTNLSFVSSKNSSSHHLPFHHFLSITLTMVFTFLLLLFLFIVGLLNFYFFSPSKKVQAKSIHINPSPTTASMNTATSQVGSQKEVMGTVCFEDKKSELNRVFDTFDKNGDGFITKQELKQSLKNIGILVSDKEVEEMMSKVDSNGDELIDLEEFYSLCEAIESRENEGSLGKVQEGDEEVDLKEAFDVFDKDQDGQISVGELGSVLNSLGLKEGKKVEDCKEMIKKVDMDGDGMVNFDEFKKMMRNGGAVLFLEKST